jgi:hypothetical protein
VRPHARYPSTWCWAKPDRRPLTVRAVPPGGSSRRCGTGTPQDLLRKSRAFPTLREFTGRWSMQSTPTALSRPRRQPLLSVPSETHDEAGSGFGAVALTHRRSRDGHGPAACCPHHRRLPRRCGRRIRHVAEDRHAPSLPGSTEVELLLVVLRSPKHH